MIYFTQFTVRILHNRSWRIYIPKWFTSPRNQATGRVCHYPQRFMGKIVNVSRFRRDRVKYASRETDEWKPGIKTFLRFLKKISVESDLENFQDLIVALDACFSLHKAIWISLSLFGDYRRCDFSRFQRHFLRFLASQKILCTVWRWVYVYIFCLRVKETCSS